MASIAVIPARAGSKRIPGKNLMDFDGHPLLAHTVRAAADSGIFDTIAFSSDSDEMLKAAEDYGAVPVKRPEEFATDTAGFYETMMHAIDFFRPKEFTNLCLLMPNCPLRNSADIEKSYGAFKNCGSAFMISVFKYHMFYPFWALHETNKGIKPFFPEYFEKGSQNFGEVYCPTGAIWWTKIQEYKEHKDFYGPNLRHFELPWYRAVDIDTYDDLQTANIVLSAMKSNPIIFSE